MIVTNGSRLYEVGRLVAETSVYRLYICAVGGDEYGHLLQIAVDVSSNGPLDRAAYYLRMLRSHAERLENEYARVRKDPNAMLNYHYAFPEVADSFLSPDKGGRRVNILRFHNIDNVGRMVPLHNIVHRDRRRVDIRSSVWIMGKLLKILTFVHDAGLSMRGLITTGNILIEPEEHYVVIFNLAEAQKEGNVVPIAVVRDDIKRAAACVINVLGGNKKGGIPEDDSKEFPVYVERLLSLANNGHRDAKAAHQEFYHLVDSLWPRGYHPFTTIPLA